MHDHVALPRPPASVASIAAIVADVLRHAKRRSAREPRIRLADLPWQAGLCWASMRTDETMNVTTFGRTSPVVAAGDGPGG